MLWASPGAGGPNFNAMNEKALSNIHNGHILGATAVLFTPMAVLLAKGIAPLFALAAVAILVLGILRDRSVRLLPGPVTLSLATMAGWALLTWFWSITPGETLKTGVSLAATFLGGAVLAAAGAGLGGREKDVFRNGILLGGAIGFPLIAFEFATDAWLTQFLYGLAGKMIFMIDVGHISVLNPGMAAMALYFWPWAWAMRLGYSASVSGVAIAAAIGLILWSNADAVILGFIAGAVVFAAALVLARRMPLIMAAVICVGVLTAPAMPGLLPDPVKSASYTSWLSNSGLHRLYIWQNTVKYIKKKPILGGGFDTARALYGPEDREIVRFAKKIGGVAYQVKYEPIPLHPHNGVLQVWLEMGALGALILMALLLSVLRAIHRFVEGTVNRAAALGLFTTGLTIASISFGAWQSWWMTAMLLGGTFLVSVLGPYSWDGEKGGNGDLPGKL